MSNYRNLIISLGLALATLPAHADAVVATSATSTSDAAYLKRIEANYTEFAGSSSNLHSLTTGLRQGSTVTLTDASGGGVTFTPPTKPMGYGNISRTLDFASRDLAAAGITDPTAAQLQTALTGGTVINAQGQATTLEGVLQLRSQGMGWGQVAHQLGISPAASSNGQAASSAGHGAAVVSAAGTSSAGLTTAGGKSSFAAGRNKVDSGLVSADGSKAGASGVVTAAGGAGKGVSNAYGHDKAIVSAAGSSNASVNAGITTGAGGAGGGAAIHSALGASGGGGHGLGLAKGKN